MNGPGAIVWPDQSSSTLIPIPRPKSLPPITPGRQADPTKRRTSQDCHCDLYRTIHSTHLAALITDMHPPYPPIHVCVVDCILVHKNHKLSGCPLPKDLDFPTLMKYKIPHCPSSYVLTCCRPVLHELKSCNGVERGPGNMATIVVHTISWEYSYLHTTAGFPALHHVPSCQVHF